MNRDGYNRIAASFDLDRRRLREIEQAYLDCLLECVAPGDRILDLGCGTGRPIAEQLLSRGYPVTGVDQAEAMLAYARSRLPAGEWITQTIESYVPETNTAAIICWDALFHLDRSLHEGLLQRWFARLRPGGRLLVTFGGSAHPAFVDSMFRVPFFYDSHPPEVFLAMARSIGFTIVLADFLDVPDGQRDKGRYGAVCAKP